MIDKNTLKEYINSIHGDHVNNITSITIERKRYYKNQIHPESSYYDSIKKDGFIELDMIKPIWNGWVSDGLNNWQYKDSINNRRFNLDRYKDWLVERRDKKINEILGMY